MAEHPEMIFVEDSGRGWRCVVASPEPKKIVEAPWCEADQGNPACLIWRGAVLKTAGARLSPRQRRQTNCPEPRSAPPGSRR